MFELFGFVLPEWVAVLGGLIWAISGVLGFLFALAMLFDAYKRPFPSLVKKVFWILVIIFPFGSLVYFYVFDLHKVAKKKKKK